MKTRLTEIEPTPDVFAAVMATGILSVAARNLHYDMISGTLSVVASVALAVLVVLVVAAWAYCGVVRRRALWNMAQPDITLRLFTFVAACDVLDSRVSTNVQVVRALGATALSAWVVLVVLTARNMSARPWGALRDRAHGAWELASVGTSGLAIVMTLAYRYTGHRWWLAIAVPVWLAAIGIYALMTWLILWRVVAERYDRRGFEPDSWILMGGLAIATLAGDHLRLQLAGWPAEWVQWVTVVTWTLATLWIPPLIYFGLHRIGQRPEVLHFAGVWWSLVFPLGMYSAATYAMAVGIGQRSLATVSLVFFWNALVAWLSVAVAGLLRLRRSFVG